MIQETIENRIMKQDVLDKIESVCERSKSIINSLYSNQNDLLVIKCCCIREIIENNKANNTRNRFTMLQEVSNATGVYLFINSEHVPVYIGVGGVGKSDDLADRVRNECKLHPNEDSGATLSKNIKENSRLLCNELSDEQIKSMICSFEVVVIKVGEMNEPENQKFANYLESLLILLFKPLHNKQG